MGASRMPGTSSTRLTFLALIGVLIITANVYSSWRNAHCLGTTCQSFWPSSQQQHTDSTAPFSPSSSEHSSSSTPEFGPYERTGKWGPYKRTKMERINPADYPDTCSFPPASSHDGDHQQNPSTTPPPLIPKFVHFVRLHDTDASFGLLEYLVIRAAHVNIRPIRIFYHHRALPSTDNEWWERARGMITDLVYTDDFGAVFGNVVEKGAHKADVVRLRALMKWGGIYLDMDVIVTKPLDPLLHHPLVMGLEGHTAPYIGLCNAVILASPSSAFLHRWYAAYTTFNDAAWSDHSVVLPYNMSLTAPEGEICVLPPTSFFWPGYWPNHQAFVHLEDEWNFYNDYQYASHVYNTGKKYLWNLSVKGIRTRNSSFTRLVRPYLPDDV